MPALAEALIERRRQEALARRELRCMRRDALLQLSVVFALTVPIIAALLPEDGPVVIGQEHIASIPPTLTVAPTQNEVVATGETGEAAIPILATAPRQSPTHPAPHSVRRTARRHGGSTVSRWVAHECVEVAELVRRHGMPAWMTTVAWRESRCRHEVTNFNRRTADRSYGLFQINVLGDLWAESRERCGLARPEELLDPHVNVSCAAALYRAYGYRPWDSGRYFDR